MLKSEVRSSCTFKAPPPVPHQSFLIGQLVEVFLWAGLGPVQTAWLERGWSETPRLAVTVCDVSVSSGGDMVSGWV